MIDYFPLIFIFIIVLGTYSLMQLDQLRMDLIEWYRNLQK